MLSSAQLLRDGALGVAAAQRGGHEDKSAVSRHAFFLTPERQDAQLCAHLLRDGALGIATAQRGHENKLLDALLYGCLDHVDIALHRL